MSTLRCGPFQRMAYPNASFPPSLRIVVQEFSCLWESLLFCPDVRQENAQPY